eukprot:TRINITY_DN7571_c0_g1_i7.p1 TRINITY_DN7571_c0_g1~~TRINITY_DN7571_c0_g1_i7.p1  ORF type:complete len:444 (+),score=112.29 TRINITY_DN7571_c0_g1_i7:25-1356(+)
MSFRDTFTRDDSDSNLQYDDTASYYYISTILVVIAIPLAWNVVKNILASLKSSDEKVNRAGQISSDLIKGAAEMTKKKVITGGFLIKVFILIVVTLFTYQLLSRAASHKQLKGFDPYEILEVERGATEKEIRRAYRAMAKRFHPDKNPDDPQATAKFLLITKAHECLTDEKAKVNCERFGNPDGPGTFHVSIALPSFLVEKKNQVAVLVFFFLIILVVIPGGVVYWYNETSKYDEKGVINDNGKIFYAGLNENTIPKNLPEVLGHCYEFSEIPVLPSQQQDFFNLKREIEDEIPKKKYETRNMKTIMSIIGYLNRKPIGPTLQKDLLVVLKKSPVLIQSMAEFAMKFQKIKGAKSFGLRCALNIIDFGQMFFQGIWDQDAYLLQLPSFDAESYQLVTKKFKKPGRIQELQSLPPDQRKCFQILDEPLRNKLNQELDALPKLAV